MSLDIALSFAAIFGLLAVSAFFSGSETALTAVSKARMHRLENTGSRRAKHVNALIDHREKLIGAMLLGNTFVNILASALATSVSLRLFESGGVVIATVAMTVFILIFAEVMPKTLAIVQTDRVALTVAPLAHAVVTVIAPIVSTVQFIVWRIFNLFGLRVDTGVPAVTAEEEIRGAIDLHHHEGTVETEHRHMLGGVLDLAELQVGDVMVHRKNMDIIDGSLSAQEIVDYIFASGHMRFPVSRDAPENIVGVLYVKDVLRALSARRGSLEGLDVLSLATAPWFVPETTTLAEQLDAFREKGAHFSLVVDEYGTLQGLVTLEDILEEVFGNMSESRRPHAPAGIRRQADGSYNVDGWVPIRDINRELGWSLPDEEATTIAGLVIHEAQTIPDIGQIFSFYGFKFEVLRRSRNQITALRITPAPKAVAA